MKVILSDGSGVTSRQLATVLAQQGHEVHILCPPGITLTKLTTCVTKTHAVPPFGSDPYWWLDAALGILRTGAFDILLPSQEQVAILSAEARRVQQTGVKLAVPPFKALSRVMEKVSAFETLRDLGLRQPETVVVGSREEIVDCFDMLPLYVKIPIGTSSKGVQRAETSHTLDMLAHQHEKKGSFADGGRLVVQRAVDGPVLMISSVFCRGVLISWHACLKIKDGPSGGAAQKLSLPLAFVGDDLAKLGKDLQWHGALSMDAIFVVTESEVYYIDVNPRIVEPMNALYSGADLVGDLLRVSLTDQLSLPDTPLVGRVEQRSHQVLLSLLEVADEGRLRVLEEALSALLGWGNYRGSKEELTPLGCDWISMSFISLMALLLLIFGGRLAKHLNKGTSDTYALTPSGWGSIKRQQRLSTTRFGLPHGI